MGVPYADVIGDPVSHSKSPLIHQFWLAKAGATGAYRATQVAPHALPSYFEARRADPDWRGCNVTMPHKLAIWPLLCPEDAAGAGAAVNCVVALETGIRLFNFDVDALLETIPGGQGPVALLGAGGAAMAAVEAMRDRPIAVVSRDPAKARRLEEQGSDGYVRRYSFDEAARALADAEGLINATPLGMRGAGEMPPTVLRNLGLLRPDAFVYDMVYHPPRTALLEQAERTGLHAIDGFTMLIEQAALAFGKFFGMPAPREHDAELRELLVR